VSGGEGGFFHDGSFGRVRAVETLRRDEARADTFFTLFDDLRRESEREPRV
jgi:hypothetical protein